MNSPWVGVWRGTAWPQQHDNQVQPHVTVGWPVPQPITPQQHQLMQQNRASTGTPEPTPWQQERKETIESSKHELEQEPLQTMPPHMMLGCAHMPPHLATAAHNQDWNRVWASNHYQPQAQGHWVTTSCHPVAPPLFIPQQAVMSTQVPPQIIQVGHAVDIGMQHCSAEAEDDGSNCTMPKTLPLTLPPHLASLSSDQHHQWAPHAVQEMQPPHLSTTHSHVWQQMKTVQPQQPQPRQQQQPQAQVPPQQQQSTESYFYYDPLARHQQQQQLQQAQHVHQLQPHWHEQRQNSQQQHTVTQQCTQQQQQSEGDMHRPLQQEPQQQKQKLTMKQVFWNFQQNMKNVNETYAHRLAQERIEERRRELMEVAASSRVSDCRQGLQRQRVRDDEAVTARSRDQSDGALRRRVQQQQEASPADEDDHGDEVQVDTVGVVAADEDDHGDEVQVDSVGEAEAEEELDSDGGSELGFQREGLPTRQVVHWPENERESVELRTEAMHAALVEIARARGEFLQGQHHHRASLPMPTVTFGGLEVLTRAAQAKVYHGLFQKWYDQQDWHGCKPTMKRARCGFKSYCHQRYGGLQCVKFLIAVGSDEGRWMSVAKAATDAVVAARISERKQHAARVAKPPNDDDRDAPCDDKLPVPVGASTQQFSKQLRKKKYELNCAKTVAEKERLQAQIDMLESQYKEKA